MDILRHSYISQLRRQGYTFRACIPHAGASYQDVRRALQEDTTNLAASSEHDRAEALAELRAEIQTRGGVDTWWASIHPGVTYPRPNGADETLGGNPNRP